MPHNCHPFLILHVNYGCGASDSVTMHGSTNCMARLVKSAVCHEVRSSGGSVEGVLSC
jgi:hypothetical protein